MGLVTIVKTIADVDKFNTERKLVWSELAELEKYS